MDKADTLNQLLEQHAPAAARCLSHLGRALAFPDGVPAQSYEAAGCEYRATIGQFTDGYGHAMPPEALSRLVPDLDPDMAFLYGHAAGLKPLREAWQRRLRREGGDTPISMPVVTLGLTHGLSICADLFMDEETEVLIPTPYWGNYRLMFGMRHKAKLRGFAFFQEGRFNVEGLREALAQAPDKAVLLLNFPSNPNGYTPSLGEVEGILEVILAHPRPLVVLLDDAYHGMVYEDDALRESLFWALSRRGDRSRLLAVKIDGCTKELFFFAGRVGFVTFGLDGPPAEALVDKLMGAIRCSVSTPPGPTQVMALAALADPDLDGQIQRRFEMLLGRYRALRAALHEQGLEPRPFNSGFFALLPLPAHLDAHTVRKQLIAEQSVGVIAVPEINALRVAFCSMRDEQMGELARRIRAVVG